MSGSQMIAACSIAGSDSGGGAGIQADLKTFTAIGVWGLTVITAVTAQNTREVRGSWTLPPEAVAAQIAAVRDDFAIGAFKTGMLGTAGIIRTVAENLPAGVPVVVDPVMVSTSGHRLLAEDAVADLVDLLISRADIVTPNIPEAEVLTGMRIGTPTDMAEAGRRIRDFGASAVVVKGGHLPGERAVDVLVDESGVLHISGKMHPYSVHGSGCCYAAALAAYRACDHGVREAAGAARSFVEEAIASAAGAPGSSRIVNPGAAAFQPKRPDTG
jgi:hydroxymethylpyrimidine/phosphomethylpyrimidine kinase